MPDTPKVVIVTRTRNRTNLLRRAIQSVLGQTCGDWRHVIVNDGGRHRELEELCAEFTDAYAGRLELLHIRHAGMQEAANAAIRASDSTYLVIHDDDDSWDPGFLHETVAFLDAAGPESPYQGVICKTTRILEAEQPDGTFRELERRPYVPLKEINFFRIGYENPFAPIAFLYRRSVHERIGLFDPRWDLVADLDFNFRFLQQFEIGVVDKPLAFYHWRDSAASKASTNTVTAQKDRHALFLNELRNHYMRRADSAREVANALSFQISPYLVENQWMTAEVRERAIETSRILDNLAAQLAALSAFHDKTLWPKLDAEILPRLDALVQAAAQLETIKEALGDQQKFNHAALWPKLEADILPKLQAIVTAIDGLAHVNIQLEQLRTFNAESLWPKLEGDLLPRLQGIADWVAELAALKIQLDQLQQFNDRELWPKLASDILPRLQSLQEAVAALPTLNQQLGQLQEFHNEELWPKLASDILPRLQSLQEAVTALPTLNQQLGQLQEFHNEALWPKLEADILPKLQAILESIQQLSSLREQQEQLARHQEQLLLPRLDSLAAALQALPGTLATIEPAILSRIDETHQQQAGNLQAIRDELRSLREQSLRQWQWGRLRLQWLDKSRPAADDQQG